MGPSFEVSLSKCTEMVNEHMGEIRSESLDVTELQLDITVTPAAHVSEWLQLKKRITACINGNLENLESTYITHSSVNGHLL